MHFPHNINKMPRKQESDISEEGDESSGGEEVKSLSKRKGRVELEEAVSRGGRIIDVLRETGTKKATSDGSKGNIKKIVRVVKKESIVKETCDEKVGYVYLKSGKTLLYETPSKKYYTLKSNGEGKNYVTKRVKEGKLEVYEE